MPTPRRTFLGLLGGFPLLGSWFSSGVSSAVAAETASSAGRDVMKELGIRTFINAGGTYTALSGSLMLPEVVAAIQVASKKFCRLEDMQDAVGKRIAELLKCEAAMVTSGCASALQFATVAVVAGKNTANIRQLPDTTGMKSEVLVQKTHRVGYDHAIRNLGMKMIEVETREELEKAIGPKTAMMFFLNYSNSVGKIKHEEFIEIAKKHNIPTLIDAAADVPPAENLFKYTKMGFDLVAFSGGKGMRGPQSAGMLLGKKEFIDAAKLSAPPNGDTPCRTNKVNKEEMIGMLVAVESFLARDHAAVWKDWEARCQKITDALKGFDDVKTTVEVPPVANNVPHLQITWDAAKRGVTSQQVVAQLRAGEPSIELAPGGGGGRGGGAAQITVGVWMMDPGEDAIVASRLKAILGKGPA